ncbi:MAG TPA: hypothetical protein VG406_03680 [Isosphaeraceae bacterium]|jgi:hypothetical protein|nr:hypothetical protein [Isosphaeraceae bacterium]
MPLACPRDERDRGAATLPAAPRRLTASRRWKLRRDAVIYTAARTFSLRYLADVFGLSRGGVADILARMRREEERRRHAS